MSLSSDREPTGAGAQVPLGPGLTPDQLKAKLSLYVGSLPSTVIEDLFQTLKPMSLPEAKVDEIIERTIKTYSGQDSNNRMDELVEKMNNLEDTLIRALKSIETRPERVQQEQEQPPAVEQPPQAFKPVPTPAPAPHFEEKRRVRIPEPEPEPEETYDDEPPMQEPDFVQGPKRQRILLPDIPDNAMNNAVLLKWVEFLLETVGHQNLPEVLDYYVDIGWISEKVTMKLLAYASGMVAPRGRAKEKLSTKDHLRSLLFIEKLRGKDFDQSKLTRLEREIQYTIEKRIRSD